MPFWYLPQDAENSEDCEKIERHFFQYPFSSDIEKYNRLIKVLSLYRLTLGQPRQEELISMLEDKISVDEFKQFLINLSPFDKESKYH